MQGQPCSKIIKNNDYVGVNPIGELIVCDKDDAIGQVIGETSNDITIHFKDYNTIGLASQEHTQQPSITINIEKVIINE